MKIPYLAKICLIWGIFWGTLGTVLFFLGLINLWYGPILIIAFAIGLIILGFYLWKTEFISQTQAYLRSAKNNLLKDKVALALFCLIVLTSLFYLIGAIAPEKEFDALWYHLTLPKIFLADHSVHFIAGGLLYYSVMPQLAEMFYGLMLAVVSNGILAKLLHFSFGLMWLGFSYQIFRLFFRQRLALLLTLVISSLSTVCFLATSAYIDLVVAFYVAGLIWSYINFIQTKDVKYLYLAGIFAGFNLASKFYGLIIFGCVWLILLFQKNWKILLIYSGIALALAVPYFLHAYFTTGNPIYPVLSLPDQSYKIWISGANNYLDWIMFIWPQKIIGLIWRILIYDFTPVFGLIFLLPFYFKKQSVAIKNLFIVFLIFIFLWSLHPVWELRYLMVILPLFGLLTGIVIQKINFLSGKIMVGLIVITGLLVSFQANWQQLQPAFSLASGKLTSEQYLSKYVGSHWYNFYEGKDLIKLAQADKLLTINYHNLFYAPAETIDWSYLSKDVTESNFFPEIKKRQIKYIAVAEFPLDKLIKLSQAEIDTNLNLIWQKDKQWLFEVKQ